jgi:hypothetical protein
MDFYGILAELVMRLADRARFASAKEGAEGSEGDVSRALANGG